MSRANHQPIVVAIFGNRVLANRKVPARLSRVDYVNQVACNAFLSFFIST